MDADMKRMMAEMQASIQALATQMQVAIKGLEGRFDGLEGRFDGLETRLDKKFYRLSLEFDRFRHVMRQEFRDEVEKLQGIYRHTAWAADSARASASKAISHGPMLIDHEDRIRALEGKRKTRPAA